MIDFVLQPQSRSAYLMNMRLTASLILSAALLTACTQPSPPHEPVTPPATQLPLRPASSPDYYILGISGKCLRDALGRYCFNLLPSRTSAARLTAQNTRNNWNYLQPRGTLDAVATAVRKRGWSVAVKGYAASLQDRVNTSSGTTETHPGFLSLYQDVQTIFWRDIYGVRNPSRLILVAHSHGTVYSHLLTWMEPNLPVEIQVDLDGVCAYWQTDNQGDFRDANFLPGLDFEAVCRTRDSAQGGSPGDLQNVTFANVRSNLDVHSNDPLLLDLTPNRRPNGSAQDIWSADFQEDHSGVTNVGSQAMAWVTQSVFNLTPQR